jgi:predicted TIM-barrel fold metal-dependent hydrolase
MGGISRRGVAAGMAAAAAPKSLSAQGRAQSDSKERKVKIVDSQVHMWRGMLPPPSAHRKVMSFWSEDLLAEMDAAGVDGAILCPPAFFPAANQLYREVIDRHLDRFAGWGFFPIDSPAREEIIRTWRQPPYMLGLRYTFITPETRPYWTNGAMDWLWPAAEKAGVPLGFYAFGRLDVIADRAQRHPNLKIVLDHMNIDASKKGADTFSEFPQLLALAKYPNIAVKVNSLPAQSLEAYPYRDMHEPLRRCIDAFGPERCIWGSDLTRMAPVTYRQCVTMFTEELPWLEGEALKLVMGESLMRWLDFRFKGWA